MATMLEAEQLSFWDALILEAARLSGADRVLTEDLQHGRIVGGVRIENPFAALGTRPPGAERPASGR